MSDDAVKEKSPAPEIDKAIKALLKDMNDAETPPETVRAKAAAISVAINWQKVKHHIKDEGEPDLNYD